MNNYIHKINVMGRFAYILMCIERFLVNVYPDRDWRLLAEAFWQFSQWDCSDWLFFYRALTPNVVMHGGTYSREIRGFFTLEEYQTLAQQYQGITRGDVEDPKDVVSFVLNIPFDLMNLYDAVMTDGNSDHEQWALDASIGKIKIIEKLLSDRHIELPDIHKLDFLTIQDDDNWGDFFDGKPLSIILNKE